MKGDLMGYNRTVMSPFKTATLSMILVLVAAFLLLDGAARTVSVLIVLVGYVTLVGLGVFFIGLGFFAPALCRGDGRSKNVFLTFDDGPDPQVTPGLLDLLKAQGVKAAFFCVGEKVRAHPDLARRTAEEGHLLCNHTYRHAWWTNFLLEKGLAKEMERTRKAMEEAAGVRPRFFRPPMGLTNPHLPAALRREGLMLVGWDVRALDRGRDWQGTVDRVLKRVRNGSIIALHDGGVPAKRALAAVSGIVKGLNDQGFEPKRLDVLLEKVAEDP